MQYYYPNLQIRKVRHREVKTAAQGYIASKRWIQGRKKQPVPNKAEDYDIHTRKCEILYVTLTCSF